jgi:thioredoxin 1
MACLSVTDQSFAADVLAAPLPVVVDFSASWCAPCKAIRLTLEEIAEESPGAFRLVELGADDDMETPNRYGVRSFPTIVVFKAGEPVAIKVGAAAKSELRAFIRAAL